MDPKIIEAIHAAVSEADQSQGLARKIAKWFEAIASGNEDIKDRQTAYRHLELLYGETRTIKDGFVEPITRNEEVSSFGNEEH